MRLRQVLDERFGLLVSLPRNEVALARAAMDGGADAIKVHLNVHHHASGTHFRGWAEEQKTIRAILEAVDIPVGVVPGAETIAPEEDLDALAAAGVDFWDTFAHHALTRLLARRDMGCMMAVNYQFPLEQAADLVALGAQVIEASIIPSAEYGSPLTARDLVSYRALTRAAAGTPVVIPSQRRYQPADVPFFKRAGARGLVIGAIVTGADADSLRQATSEFRRAIDMAALADDELDIAPPVSASKR